MADIGLLTISTYLRHQRKVHMSTRSTGRDLKMRSTSNKAKYSAPSPSSLARCARCLTREASVEYRNDFEQSLCDTCLEIVEREYAIDQDVERQIDDEIERRCKKEGK
jgi:RNA polymerase-interacting CarD/CdnL/TRCF family regulator